MKLEPEPETKYNLALCIEQKALSLLNKVKGRFLAVNENSLNLVQGARRDLDDVIAMYKNLAGDDLAPSYVKKLAMTRQKIVTKQLGFGDENVKRFVKEYEKVQKSLSKMTDLAESKRKEMEAEIKRIEEEKKRQILEEAARAEEASKALVNNVKGNLELSLTTKKRRPRDADAEGSDSDVEETEDAISRNPKKLKRSKKESASLKSVDSQEMHDTAIEALPVKKQMRKKALADLSSSEDDLDKDQILAPSPEIEDDN